MFLIKEFMKYNKNRFIFIFNQILEGLSFTLKLYKLKNIIFILSFILFRNYTTDIFISSHSHNQLIIELLILGLLILFCWYKKKWIYKKFNEFKYEPIKYMTIFISSIFIINLLLTSLIHILLFLDNPFLSTYILPHLQTSFLSKIMYSSMLADIFYKFTGFSADYLTKISKDSFYVFLSKFKINTLWFDSNLKGFKLNLSFIYNSYLSSLTNYQVYLYRIYYGYLVFDTIYVNPIFIYYSLIVFEFKLRIYNIFNDFLIDYQLNWSRIYNRCLSNLTNYQVYLYRTYYSSLLGFYTIYNYIFVLHCNLSEFLYYVIRLLPEFIIVEPLYMMAGNGGLNSYGSSSGNATGAGAGAGAGAGGGAGIGGPSTSGNAGVLPGPYKTSPETGISLNDIIPSPYFHSNDPKLTWEYVVFHNDNKNKLIMPDNYFTGLIEIFNPNMMRSNSMWKIVGGSADGEDYSEGSYHNEPLRLKSTLRDREFIMPPNPRPNTTGLYVREIKGRNYEYYPLDIGNSSHINRTVYLKRIDGQGYAKISLSLDRKIRVHPQQN